MLVLHLIVCLAAVLVPGVLPGWAGETPPEAVARDIELLNRMLQQRKVNAPVPAPSPADLPTPQPEPAAPAAGTVELIAGLADEDKAAREEKQRALVRIGRPAVPELIEALEDGPLRVRTAAAWVLGRIKDPRGAEALAALLEDPSHEIWEAAYHALVKFGRAAEPALLDALGDPDDLVRWKAVHLLGRIRGPGASEALIALLNKDRSTRVRVEIGTALGRIKDRAACDALLDALHDW